MKLKGAYLLSLATAMMNNINLSSAKQARDHDVGDFCLDKKKVSYGPGGQRVETAEGFENTILLNRKGGMNCPCSYVSLGRMIVKKTKILHHFFLNKLVTQHIHLLYTNTDKHQMYIKDRRRSARL